MIGGILSRQAARLASRSAPRSRQLSTKVVQDQKAFQGGSTPYLRGDADPTYLRMGGSDKVIAGVGLVIGALIWVNAFSGGADMMHGRNKKEI